jgi:hypothetical protein
VCHVWFTFGATNLGVVTNSLQWILSLDLVIVFVAAFFAPDSRSFAQIIHSSLFTAHALPLSDLQSFSRRARKKCQARREAAAKKNDARPESALAASATDTGGAARRQEGVELARHTGSDVAPASRHATVDTVGTPCSHEGAAPVRARP